MSNQIPNPVNRFGRLRVDRVPCGVCRGRGKVPVLLVFSKTCPVCDGTGLRWVFVTKAANEL